MRIIWQNLLDDYTLTESQEDENYPIENVQDIRLAKKWRTKTASAASIVLDAGTGLTITCDCCAVLEHNLDNASAEVYIQAHASDSWGTPSLSSLITCTAGIMVKFFESTTKRFWRFYIDNLTNPLGYYEIGRLFLGEYLQISPSSFVEFPEKHPRSDRISFSITNQPYSDEGLEHKELDYRFEYCSAGMKNSIETMWGSCGMWKPLILLNYDETYTVIPPLYCAIIEPIIFEHLTFDRWNFALELRECD